MATAATGKRGKGRLIALIVVLVLVLLAVGRISSHARSSSASDNELQTWSEGMTAALGTISKLQDQNFSNRVLAGERDARAEFAASLSVLEQCSSTVPASAPQGFVDACPHYENAAHSFAKGVDHVNADELDAATAELTQATAIMQASVPAN